MTKTTAKSQASSVKVSPNKNLKKSPKNLKTVLPVSKPKRLNLRLDTPSKNVSDDEKKGANKSSSLKKLKKFLGSGDSINKKTKTPSRKSLSLAMNNSFSDQDSSLVEPTRRKTRHSLMLPTNQSRESISSKTSKDSKSSLKGLFKKVQKKKSISENDLTNNSKPPKKPKLDLPDSFQTQPKQKIQDPNEKTKKQKSRKHPSPAHQSSPSKSLNPWTRCLGEERVGDSNLEGGKVFDHLIQPVTSQKFFRDIWEKKPLLVRRHNPTYNNGLFSTSELDRILREETLNFSENIDIVTYLDEQRETHNPDGRAHAPIVWDFYQQGCSVRLLNPQTYCRPVWCVLSLLQEFFSCMAGANIYLTPPGTQGFAPHWDDIEAFILQVEGKKHWKIYEPRNESEVLPRFSSPNFKSSDLSEPVLDVVLEAGDLLYFPRGFIHQGRALDDSHSLHITISVGQRNTWGDLMQKMLPRAIELAMEEDVEYRTSLPCNYLNYMGIAFSDYETEHRSKFNEKLKHLLDKLWTYCPVDPAVDQLGASYLKSSLPPCLTQYEKDCSVFGNGEKWSESKGRVVNACEIEPDTEIRIIRRGSVRLVSEEVVSIYHNLENARVYEGAESKCIEVQPEEAGVVEFLVNKYPEFVLVEELPLDSQERQISLAQLLYNRGLIITKSPIISFGDDDDEEEDADDDGDAGANQCDDDDADDN